MWVVALPFVLVLLCALILHEVAVDVGIPRPGLFTVVVVLVTWVPVELLLVLFLRDHRALRLVPDEPGPKNNAKG
jgi:hypothetical protein